MVILLGPAMGELRDAMALKAPGGGAAPPAGSKQVTPPPHSPPPWPRPPSGWAHAQARAHERCVRRPRRSPSSLTPALTPHPSPLPFTPSLTPTPWPAHRRARRAARRGRGHSRRGPSWRRPSARGASGARRPASRARRLRPRAARPSRWSCPPVCHTGLEPRTSRPHTGLLLTRLSPALDRCATRRHHDSHDAGGAADEGGAAGREGAAACCGPGAGPVPREPHALCRLGLSHVRRATYAIGPSTLQVVVPEGAEPGDTLTLAMTG